MSRETIQIRLAQPPLFLLGAVVIAAVLPLFAGAASGSVERLRRFAFTGINMHQLGPKMTPAVVAGDAEVDEPDAVQIVEPEFVEQEPAVVPSKQRARREPSASPTSLAAVACERQDKHAARAVYRSLERGDPRRKEIRKSCRKSGVLIF